MSRAETTILRREIRTQRDHIAALRQALEEESRLRDERLGTLLGAFRNLRPLLHELWWALEAADPAKSKEIDGQLVMSSGEPPDEGAATRSARLRLRWLDRQLERMVSTMTADHEDGPKVEKPRCRSRQCSWYGRRQNLGQRYCGACGGEMAKKEGGE